MAFKLPLFDRTLPLVKDDKTPSLTFHQWWQSVVRSLERALNGLDAAVNAIEDALEAAGIAIAAAEAAQEAADLAQNAANNAGGLADVTTSGTNDVAITATDAGTDVTISIAAHNRIYSSGTTVAVNAGNITGQNYSTTYYIYYDDPSRAGGAVTYFATTSRETAAQVGNRHLVGDVLTPASGAPPADGIPKPPPGMEREIP